MMPQSNLLVTAALRPERETELRSLLASMNETSGNQTPGRVNPANALLPFGQFKQIHVARFVILDDQTTGDLQLDYAEPAPNYPLMLAFAADFDGPADALRADLAARTGKGLERIFSCCQGFTAGTDIAQWMKAHETPPSTNYINWLGRTVGQIREEDALRLALEDHLQSHASLFSAMGSQETHAALRAFMQGEIRAGRLALTPPPPTPFGWQLSKLLNLVGVPLLLLVLAPLLILYLPIFAIQLRSREKKDPEIAPRVKASWAEQLATIEDYDVTNQFTAMGSLKPGLFRRWTLAFLLWALNYTTRHIYTRGHLARVGTIHFARWVFINDRRRLLFCSNYDGALSTYMDDFINKVGWGLNLVFSNGVGYPSSRWLILDGAKEEQEFKNFLRRHQLPTQVWYKAYPGLTAFDLKRNTLIREGIENPSLAGADLRQWVALF